MPDQQHWTLKDIKDYFGYDNLTKFSKDWQRLSDKDKDDIRRGLENGTYTY